MKTSGAVYKKLREVKYRHLVELYKKYLRRSPELCLYNRMFRVESDGVVREVRLCFLHQPEQGLAPHLLDVCEQVGHCVECNAFVCKFTKESVRELFEKELSDPAVKGKKYPAVCTLEWVLEQSAVGVPPFETHWFQRLFRAIKNTIIKAK